MEDHHFFQHYTHLDKTSQPLFSTNPDEIYNSKIIITTEPQLSEPISDATVCVQEGEKLTIVGSEHNNKCFVLNEDYKVTDAEKTLPMSEDKPTDSQNLSISQDNKSYLEDDSPIPKYFTTYKKCSVILFAYNKKYLLFLSIHGLFAFDVIGGDFKRLKTKEKITYTLGTKMILDYDNFNTLSTHHFTQMIPDDVINIIRSYCIGVHIIDVANLQHKIICLQDIVSSLRDENITLTSQTEKLPGYLQDEDLCMTYNCKNEIVAFNFNHNIIAKYVNRKKEWIKSSPMIKFKNLRKFGHVTTTNNKLCFLGGGIINNQISNTIFCIDLRTYAMIPYIKLPRGIISPGLVITDNGLHVLGGKIINDKNLLKATKDHYRVVLKRF